MNSYTKEYWQIVGEESGFSSIDQHFAHFIASIADRAKHSSFLAAALVNNALSNGHSFIDLRNYANRPLPFFQSLSPVKKYPPLETWLSDLKSSGITGEPGTYFPLILCGTRLYLYRYWRYEQQLAESILRIINLPSPEVDKNILKNNLKKLFPDTGLSDTWQQTAAATAVFNRFTVISGGPGTGKTTTVTKVIALLLMMQSSCKKMRIALAAPTGKAAARLSESVRSTIPNLPVSAQISELIPREAFTLHRLLGTIPGSPFFRYNNTNKLPYDLVVVDEASMIDLALMAKLFSAIPDSCRLIFLGDRDQLSSVEAGAAFGDICDCGNCHSFSESQCKKLASVIDNPGFSSGIEPPIADCIINLQKSYRFRSDSGIGKLAAAINKGDSSEAVGILKDNLYTDCVWKKIEDQTALNKFLYEKIDLWFKPFSNISDPESAIRSLENFRILCALRKGPFGVESINSLTRLLLYKSGHISLQSNIYSGQPVMISGNNHKLNLFNGDTGLIIPDPSETTTLKAVFKMPDATFRFFHTRRLPSYETAYSLTVHKSQGSEFDHVLLILGNSQNALLNRELLYTAITRARKSVEIWCSEPALSTAIKMRINRKSGLREKLWMMN